MNLRSLRSGAVIFFLALPLHAAVEVFEIGPRNRAELPKGKEADGILGDFVLRNSRVQALVSGNLPARRANMSTFYGADGMTPGCLYDLTFRENPNDQITIFAPAEQRGPVSFVRAIPNAVETVITAAKNNGLYVRHEYKLDDDSQGILITTTLRNESDKAIEKNIADRWTAFATNNVFRGIRWADAVDPADRAGYAYVCAECNGARIPTNNITLPPDAERTIARFLAVGRSPAEAVGIAAAREGAAARLEAEILDENGAPCATATIAIRDGNAVVPAYPDKNGKLSIPFPAGAYEVAILDLGRNPIRERVELRNNETATLKKSLPRAAAIAFEITGDSGREIPCKAQFIGIDGTPTPHLGPANRAHGCKDQYHSERGEFTTRMPPGKYRVIVTRGIEYSHLLQEIEVRPGETAAIRGQLKRLVDTSGWVSADYHNHSTPSGDNTCGTDDRIVNLAAEHIEFAPTTEHNRLYDWRPHIEKLGLAQFIQTVPGMELTGGGPHLNSFPFKPNPDLQDAGAPTWDPDPRISATLLRRHQGENPDRWIQINHPDLVMNFVDRNNDGLADSGFVGLEHMIDGLEVENFIHSTLLSPHPVRIHVNRTTKAETAIANRAFIWLQLLNRGHRLTAMAVCDAHSVHGNGVGGWRMYMPSSTDEPAKIDWKENSRYAKMGRSYLTTGPFLQVKTAEGAEPGDTIRVSGEVTLRIRVQGTDWIDIDRVQILVNGRAPAALNFTRKSHPDFFKDGVVKFDRQISVPLTEDAHLIVVACHETQTLELAYGTSDQATLHPFAFHNPIYIDVDGGGFKANGDLLDHPLPPKRYTLPQAKELLR